MMILSDQSRRGMRVRVYVFTVQCIVTDCELVREGVRE